MQDIEDLGFIGSDDYDGNPPEDWQPPSREQLELDGRAAFVACELQKCRLHPQLYFSFVSFACDSLVRLVRRRQPERLAEAGREALVRSIAEAQLILRQRAPAQAFETLAQGFEALTVLAYHLADSDEQRSLRHPDVLRDALAWARLLQNHAHNVCLAEEIAERANRRRADAVAAIIDDALAHVPQFRSAA